MIDIGEVKYTINGYYSISVFLNGYCNIIRVRETCSAYVHCLVLLHAVCSLDLTHIAVVSFEAVSPINDGDALSISVRVVAKINQSNRNCVIAHIMYHYRSLVLCKLGQFTDRSNCYTYMEFNSLF